MRTTSLSAALLLAAPAAALPGSSPVPLVIQHSGRVLDSADQGLDGTLSITFTLYKDFEKPRNGDDTVYWAETRTVQAFKGVYHVALGDVAEGGSALALDDFGDGSEERWLGIKVGTDAEMQPRLQIGSVPYALRAASAAEAVHAASAGEADRALAADTADSADDLDCAGCVGNGEIGAAAVGRAQVVAKAIGGAEIDDDAIAARHLAAGAVERASLADDAVGSDQIAEGAVLRAHLAPQAVGPNQIDAGAVGTTQLAAGAVGPTQLAAGAVGTTHIQSGAVQTDQIAAGAVTLDKLAGRNPTTGLVTGLNAEKLGGLTAAQVAAQADPSSAIASALLIFTGVQRSCDTGAGVQTFDGAAWGNCVNLRWNCSATPGHAGCVSSSQYGACSDIKSDTNFNGTDGVYYIDPDGSGTGAPFQVYCDMTTDAGGWTLIMKLSGDATLHWGTSYWTTANVLNDSDLVLSTDTNTKYASFNTVSGTSLMYYRPGLGTFMRYNFSDSRTALYRFVNGSAYGSTSGNWRPPESHNNTSNGACNGYSSQGKGVNYSQSCDGNANWSRARLGEGYEQSNTAHCIWGVGTYNNPCGVPTSGFGSPGGNVKLFVK